MDDDFRRAALDYHRLPRPGKLSVEPTKRMATQRDLALAYSPGVAAACEAIRADPATAHDYTIRGNLVAVISNGTAVLGLGNIGALAGKPVMEGKAALFKKFAGIDVFDIEVDAADPDRFCDVVAALEPTFGAINLEDIKAPECFAIEANLRARMSIPVFHDDQHGTAITVAAAVINGLRLQGKTLDQVKLVTSGAGAAALACVDLLVSMGVRVENVTLTDIAGVVRTGRPGMLPNMARYARETNVTTLEDALDGADLFLGLSAPRVLKPEWLGRLAGKPLILALANPEPEILPELARAARPDAIVATGRSDYPNQVNNVLCFPFMFRGALDVGASTIDRGMEIAAVEALAGLARMEASEVVAAAYGGAAPVFGPDYIIPAPFDPRLILEIAPAVARAAMESGVARRPIADFDAYRNELERFVFRSGQFMRPVFEAARKSLQRIVLAEGEDERVLRAAQTLVDDRIARPILLGKRDVIAAKVAAMGLRLDLGGAVRVIDPGVDNGIFDRLAAEYVRLAGRRGVPPDIAVRSLRGRGSVAAAMLLHAGEADAALVGGLANWWRQIQVHPADHPPLRRRQPGLRAGGADPAYRHPVPVRYAYGGRSHLGTDRRDDPARRRSRRRVRHRAQRGAVVALQFRRQRFRFRAQDAQRARADPRAPAKPRRGWGDERGIGAEGGHPRPCRDGQPDQGHRQPAGDAQSGCGEYRLHPAEGRSRRAVDRAAAAWDVAADPRAGAQRDGARDREPERVRGARGGTAGEIGRPRALSWTSTKGSPLMEAQGRAPGLASYASATSTIARADWMRSSRASSMVGSEVSAAA